MTPPTHPGGQLEEESPKCCTEASNSKKKIISAFLKPH